MAMGRDVGEYRGGGVLCGLYPLMRIDYLHHQMFSKFQIMPRIREWNPVNPPGSSPPICSLLYIVPLTRIGGRGGSL